MTPRGGDRGGRRPTKSPAGPGVKKSIRFSQEGAALIAEGARRLGVPFADLIETAVRAYLAEHAAHSESNAGSSSK